MRIDNPGQTFGSNIERVQNKLMHPGTTNLLEPHNSEQTKPQNSTNELRDLVGTSTIRESLVTQFKVEIQNGNLLGNEYLAKTADALLDR